MIVRFGTLICNFLMGLLLILNNNSVSHASPLHKPYWLGMIVCNVAIVKLIDSDISVNTSITVVYLVGFAVVIYSLISIGKSFAVIPMSSKIKTKLGYSVIRHPMYWGESVMLGSCVFSSLWLTISISVFVLYMYFTVKRINEEEKLLLKTYAYREYCKHTRWRLLPFVW